MSGATPHLRAMRLSDHAAVLEVARTLATWFQPLDQMALAMDLRDHEGLVAVEQGAIVAFLTYHLLDPEAAELSWLGVAASRQGQGIGGLLLGALEALLGGRGVQTLELSTVPADHEPAFAPTNAFYSHRGFAVHRRDDHFYAFGRPRVLLKKELAPDGGRGNGPGLAAL